MNRIIQIVLASILLVSGFYYPSEAEWRGGGGFSGGTHGGGYSGVRRGGGGGVMIRMRQTNISTARNAEHPTQSITGTHAQPGYPKTYANGTRITARASAVPPSGHTTIVRNPAIAQNIRSSQRVEIVPNKYYWHDVGGTRYCHYYYGGRHWYGFYSGSSFYWSLSFGGYWWWFDGSFDRWVYWRDGYWWWPGPGGVPYVYVDNNYYPYDEQGNVTVKTPEVLAPPQNIPATTEGTSWKSPDGKRMVQLYGERAEAFLYDTSSSQAVFVKYLGQGVEKARFTGGKNGKSLRILIEFKDGSFALTSEDGNPIDEEPEPMTPTGTGGSSSSVPQPPTDMPAPPGQP